MNRYEDGSYLDANPTWHEEHSEWKATHVRRLIEKNALQPKTIAEVGCGAGQILVEMSNAMPNVEQFVGYEISPQAFSICSERASDRLSYVNEDVLSSPPAEKFDIAMAIDVFEHVEDYIGFIRNMKKISHKQIFHIPLELSVSSMLRPGILDVSRQEVGHLHFFTRETAIGSLNCAGLSVIDEEQTSIAMDFSGSGKTKLLKLPRKLVSLISENATARIFGGCHLLVLTE